MKDRLWIPDYLKGLTVIVMIQVHIMETWIRQDILDTGIGEVIRRFNNIPVAITFMLLMGFLANYTKANTRKLILRGFKILLWGLLLNIGLNLHFLIKVVANLVEGQILPKILGVDIFFLAGWSLIAIGIISKSKYRVWISLVIAITISLTAPWITSWLDQINQDNYLLAMIGTHAEWSYFPIFPWLAYPLFGYSAFGLFKKFSVQKLSTSIKVIILLALMILGSLGFFYNWNDLINLTEFYHHGINVSIWGVSFTLALAILVSLLPQLNKGGFSAWIQFAGKKLTRFYVVQWLIIGNLATFFYQKLDLWAYFVGFLVVSALTTIIVYSIKDKVFKL